MGKIRNLCFDDVSNAFSYDETTGHLYWKIKPSNKINVGQIAGYTYLHTESGKSYRYVTFNKSRYGSHLIIWLLMTGSYVKEIDHIDGDGTNNKWGNLRPVTRLVNSRNTRLRSNNKSGHVGVLWDTRCGKWMSQITVRQKVIFPGRFRCIVEAIGVRRAASEKYNFYKNHGQARPL